MLAEYAASPATAWKAKDCAIYLVLALTVRGKTGASAHGATLLVCQRHPRRARKGDASRSTAGAHHKQASSSTPVR